MTDPKILQIEHYGYLEFCEDLYTELCEYGGCEIYSWENYYNFGVFGERIVCEECLREWAFEYLVRRL